VSWIDTICSKHFDNDGNPSETLIKAKQERLDNWHVLRELAGII
jgi:pyruvate ferredoxin oxidoreductase beta subunit